MHDGWHRSARSSRIPTPVPVLLHRHAPSPQARASRPREGATVMKAFIVDRYGKDSVPRAGELPDPVGGEHDVLVEVRAAGVNALDAKIKDGEFKLVLPYKPPFVLGNDLAGAVLAVGRAVRRFAPGDQVYARPDKDRIGTFAQLIAVNENDLAITGGRFLPYAASAW